MTFHGLVTNQSAESGGMNIIIPMGGLGSRFKKAGYRHPKPLIKIAGRAMVMWLIDNLSIKHQDTLWLAHMQHIEDTFQLGALLKKEYEQYDIRVVRLNFETRGAAETLYIVCQSMNEIEAARRTISLDCDTIYLTDILKPIRSLDEHVGGCVCFEDKGDVVQYSYIETDSENTIQNIREKVKISQWANTGAYIFSSGTKLRNHLCSFMNAAVDSSGEYYTSTLIKNMLSTETFKRIIISCSDFAAVGTPTQLHLFLTNLPDRSHLVKPQRFCFDLDGTLVSFPTVTGNYRTVLPITANIEILQQLKAVGHYIIIHTARRMRTCNGNVQAVIQEIGELTKETLKSFNIPYDELHFGKPYANFYVDDLSVHASLDTMQELGLLPLTNDFSTSAKKNNMIESRSFNDVKIINEHVVKISETDTLEGEIYYYRHIPQSKKKYFANVHKLEQTTLNEQYKGTIIMERIHGPTFSHLLVSRCLTVGRLNKLLIALHDLHSTKTSEIQAQTCLASIDVYANYAPKIQFRFKQNQMYTECETEKGMADTLCQILVTSLEAYKIKKAASPVSMIHGDPVFSNIILDKNSEIKMIDMRGRIGDVLTLGGDAVYDLSKVYQSLCGYDYILHDLNKENETDRQLMAELRCSFEKHLNSYYSNITIDTIKLITASLFFSLIPLHDKAIHRSAFFQACVDLMKELKLMRNFEE